VRISDRIILLRLVIGKAVFTFLSVYAPQSGLPEAVKEHFYDQLHYSALDNYVKNSVICPGGLGSCGACGRS